jgi:hypothetical protein
MTVVRRAAVSFRVRLADLHELATGARDHCGIDSKIETTHPDLRGQFAQAGTSLAERPGGAKTMARALRASSPQRVATASAWSGSHRERV